MKHSGLPTCSRLGFAPKARGASLNRPALRAVVRRALVRLPESARHPGAAWARSSARVPVRDRREQGVAQSHSRHVLHARARAALPRAQTQERARAAAQEAAREREQRSCTTRSAALNSARHPRGAEGLPQTTRTQGACPSSSPRCTNSFLSPTLTIRRPPRRASTYWGPLPKFNSAPDIPPAEPGTTAFLRASSRRNLEERA
jgi:hypothetical protein